MAGYKLSYSGEKINELLNQTDTMLKNRLYILKCELMPRNAGEDYKFRLTFNQPVCYNWTNRRGVISPSSYIMVRTIPNGDKQILNPTVEYIEPVFERYMPVKGYDYSFSKQIYLTFTYSVEAEEIFNNPNGYVLLLATYTKELKNLFFTTEELPLSYNVKISDKAMYMMQSKNFFSNTFVCDYLPEIEE